MGLQLEMWECFQRYVSNLYFPVCLRQVVIGTTTVTLTWKREQEWDWGGVTIEKSVRYITNPHSYMRERARLLQGDQQSEFCSSWWLASLTWVWRNVEVKFQVFASFIFSLTIFLRTDCRQTIALIVEDNLMIFLVTTLLLRALTSGQSTGPTTYFVSTALVENHLSSIFVSYITCSKQSSNFIICAIVI